MNGYTGKILYVNLTERKTSVIETKRYEQWGGGHGIGSQLFWDLVEDKNISGFDPQNAVTFMTSPLAGTLVPGASARTEVQGIGVQSSPIEWFTRSNFGGRFAPLLKFAGWDGVVIQGKADSPVWIDIRDDRVALEDARDLWGRDTRETQKAIWAQVSSDPNRVPAVVTIGLAGENRCRIASMVHDAGHGSGQGGFGGVLGAKNLKAISVIGKGGVQIADPKGLLETRLWAKRNYSFDIDDNKRLKEINFGTFPLGFGTPATPSTFWARPREAGPHACVACHSSCRARYKSGIGNESTCATSLFYSQFELKQRTGKVIRIMSSLMEQWGQQGAVMGMAKKFGKKSVSAFIAAELAQKYGINSAELMVGLPYLSILSKKGILGPGKAIDCDLPFDKLGGTEFAEKLLPMIANREGIGDDIAEGFYRASKRWGRLEEDLDSGLLQYAYWGLPDHYDVRAQLEWGYGSILGDRDVNEHDFNTVLHWLPCIAKWTGKKPPYTAKEAALMVSEKMMPYEGDPLMLDYSTENMYSEHIVKLVAWHRHYTRFWKQSALFCDYLFADFYNPSSADKKGMTGEGEPRFFNAVTGKNLSFVEGMELGRKIWNLDNAIWTLQGRHRDMVHFSNYIYKTPFKGMGSLSRYFMPGREKGQWKYISVEGRSHDKAKVDEWKTKYYQFEGWDVKTGWPKRSTLEELGLKNVADKLAQKGKLGSE